MRVGGQEMGKEAMEKVQDGNDKDLNSPWSNGEK